MTESRNPSLELFCSSMATFTCRQSAQPAVVYILVSLICVHTRTVFVIMSPLGENQLMKPQMKKTKRNEK